ncbi:MAG TPA: hypothetical protein VHQ01_08060, partial [Pyrinomonadaceae bacterium]|nr:hypothetical protein [Pyrinomonadaceae bacterium]
VEKMQWHYDSIISLTLLLFVIGVIALFVNRKTEQSNKLRDNRAIIISGLFSLFMLSVGSSFIWDSVPLLQKIQFPWRWLSILSIMASVTFAAAAVSLIFRRGKLNRLAMYPLVLLILAITLFDISQNIIPSIPLSKPVFDEKVANMYNEEGCQCWWPIWAKSEAFGQPESAVAGSRKATVTSWTGESRDVTVDSGDPGVLRIATFYHPYWTATVNGDQAPLTADATGAIVVPIPASESRVQIFFREPRLLGWAVVASGFVWIGFAAFFIGYFLRRKRQTPLLLT